MFILLCDVSLIIVFFFFQAEDGIRDHCVTGVQTCALPIFEPVLVAVQAVPAAPARIDRPLVLGVLLRDRLPEDLPEGDGEALERPERLRAHLRAPPGGRRSRRRSRSRSAGAPSSRT